MSSGFGDANWYTYYRDMKNQDIAEFTQNTDQSRVLERGGGYHQFAASTPTIDDEVASQNSEMSTEGPSQNAQAEQSPQDLVASWEEEAG